MLHLKRKIGFQILILLLLPVASTAEDFRLLFGLRGEWKFELGDDKRRGLPSFDDSRWEKIYAPSKWEDQGFPGYDGYAWYRKHFQAGADWKDKSISLQLGRIDDVDEVYVNGKLVGTTGRFPPDYETAYYEERNYPIPLSYLNIGGDNVIAVRVYDDELGGGMYEGNLGVYEDRNALVPELP
ncbi:MAG: sugar-binding domain-containing protein, partial [bacterium]